MSFVYSNCWKSSRSRSSSSSLHIKHAVKSVSSFSRLFTASERVRACVISDICIFIYISIKWYSHTKQLRAAESLRSSLPSSTVKVSTIYG